MVNTIVVCIISVACLKHNEGSPEQWPDPKKDPLVFIANPIEAELPGHWIPMSILKLHMKHQTTWGSTIAKTWPTTVTQRVHLKLLNKTTFRPKPTQPPTPKPTTTKPPPKPTMKKPPPKPTTKKPPPKPKPPTTKKAKPIAPTTKKPAPKKPAPTRPAPTEPEPTDPPPTDPPPTDPPPTDPPPTDPPPTDPPPTDPPPTDPPPTDPPLTYPPSTNPPPPGKTRKIPDKKKLKAKVNNN